MANKKRRCKGCKEYFDFDIFEIKRPNNNFHTIKCLLDYTQKKREDELRKQVVKLYQDKPKSNDPKKRAKERAIYWCHKYIKERDKGNGCICCGIPVPQNQAHAGHFIPAGLHSFIRFDERNINLQHKQCNLYRGGDSGMYRENLIKKIGEAAVLELEQNKHRTISRTEDDYRRISKHYQTKLKALKSVK